MAEEHSNRSDDRVSGYQSENPITPWVREQCRPYYEDKQAHLEELWELAERLAASTAVQIESGFDIAQMVRAEHRRLTDVAERQGFIHGSRATMDAFDRLLTEWLYNPRAIQRELYTYQLVLSQATVGESSPLGPPESPQATADQPAGKIPAYLRRVVDDAKAMLEEKDMVKSAVAQETAHINPAVWSTEATAGGPQ